MNTIRFLLLGVGSIMQGIAVFYLFKSSREMSRGQYLGTSFVGAFWAWSGLACITLSWAFR